MSAFSDFSPNLSGPVTFLFSDMEGSTALWGRQPQVMSAALSRHNALMQEAIDAAGGTVFKTVGDAFHAAFDHPGAALRAAQAALHAEPWARGGKCGCEWLCTPGRRSSAAGTISERT